jgi:hypothetical protein
MNLKPGKTLLKIFSKEFDYFLLIIALLFKLLKYELLREIQLLFLRQSTIQVVFQPAIKDVPLEP